MSKKRDYALFVVDIFIACNKIKRYVQGIENATLFASNEIVWDATLRELEIVGEATKHLLQANVLEEKNHRKIVDFRNIIVHGYFGIGEEEVWYVVQHKLPEYCDTLYRLVREQYIDIKNAIRFAKEEFSHQQGTLTFLNALDEKL